jgi:surfeit locus 1 family protein
VPTLAAAAMIALTLWLGRWQTDRAAEKEALQALYEARAHETPARLSGSSTSADLLYRRVIASGRWMPERQVFIDNQIHGGKAGFYVVTPLGLAGSEAAVLVNRGWVARTAAYPRAPDVAVPAGDVEVEGLAVVPPRRVLELSSETVSGNVWQNLSIERYARATGLRLLPFVVLAGSAAPGLEAVREEPDAGVEKHREYALTWFSLAATVAALWIALNVRRLR